MLNMASFDTATIKLKPYHYGIIENLITKKTAIDLSNNLPQDDSKESIRSFGSDKTYRVINNILLPINSNVINIKENFIWRTFVKELMQENYKLQLANLMKLDISQCFQEITFKQYRCGDYISPHTDRDNVALTHMIFLNQYWEDGWGGQFCVMENEHTIIESIKPLWYQSVIFCQQPNSWHSVLLCTQPEKIRLSVQVAFKYEIPSHVLPGRVENVIG